MTIDDGISSYILIRQGGIRIKYIIAFLITAAVGWLIYKILKIVIEDIKKDPITNLVIPGATSVLVSLLLQLL